jgi:hypothetical protein
LAASCLRQLNAVTGQVEINPFKRNLGKEKDDQDEGKEKQVELGKD